MPEYWIYSRTVTYSPPPPRPRKSKVPLVFVAILIALGIYGANDDKKKPSPAVGQQPSALQDQASVQSPQQEQTPPPLVEQGRPQPANPASFEFGR